MLTHIVIWRYRADVEAEVRREHLEMLKRLASIIPEVESLSAGFDELFLPRSYDSGLVATFRDRAALQAYTIHPEHIKVADFGKNISEHVASVDFEEWWNTMLYFARRLGAIQTVIIRIRETVANDGLSELGAALKKPYDASGYEIVVKPNSP
jgi:hypothetical protein